MAAADELARLIREISRVSSPLARMKLLARAWRSLRRLEPHQRRALASQVGLEGAEDVIERLAVRKAGLNAATVQRALDAVKETDTGELKQVMRGLRDPDQRKELISKGIDRVTERLLGEEQEREADEIEAALEGEPEPTVEPAKPVDEEEATPLSAEPPAPPRERRATPPVPPPVVVPPRPAEPAPPPVEAGPAKPPPRPEPPPRPTPRRAPKPPPPPSVAAPPLPRRAEGAPARSGLFGLLEAEPILIRRFRTLREHVNEAKQLSAEQLRGLLDLFPSDWSRRRALEALLEAGIPSSLNQAIFLIEQLESAGQRRWCASTLLHEWDLTESERKALVERHGLFRGA